MEAHSFWKGDRIGELLKKVVSKIKNVSPGNIKMRLEIETASRNKIGVPIYRNGYRKINFLLCIKILFLDLEIKRGLLFIKRECCNKKEDNFNKNMYSSIQRMLLRTKRWKLCIKRE